MRTLLAMAMLSGVLIAPAFAQMSAEDMTCTDFTAMDSSAQMAAVDSMEGAMGAMASDKMSSDAMSSGDMAAGDMAAEEAPLTAEKVAAACTDHPDMMVHDAVEQAKMAR